MNPNNLFSIKRHVIIVTGAGRGNGQAIATGLVNSGAIVFGLDISFDTNVKEPNFFPEICDITDSESFQNICEKIYSKYKRIDSLVNNAGITFTKKAEELYQYNHWRKTLAVNLTAVFTLSQIVLPYMVKNNTGSVINITSLGAELGFPNNPAYIASKGGLKMLTKAFAKDWGRKGIRFNNLGPGYMRTEMTEKSYNNKRTRKQREQNIMLGRWGTSEDLIGPCIFLVSKASAYITGQDIYVDGGWTANGLQYDV